MRHLHPTRFGHHGQGLWLSLLLAVYAVMVGGSGSILVLRPEFQQWTGLSPKLPPIVCEGANRVCISTTP